MTNLEKLKTEIVEMSAKDFAENMIYFLENKGDPYCTGCGLDNPDCEGCRINWLSTESEDKK